MRIISGIRRGMTLYTLKGNNTRPTSDKVKEAIFSMIQYNIADSTCLDLFSGSGAMGIEAISRGAKFSYFVDNHSQAIQIIKKNLEKAKFLSASKVMKSDAKRALKEINPESIDVLFLDPPYLMDFIPKIMELILEQKILKKSAIIVCEQNVQEEIASEYGDFKLYKTKNYSDTAITIYKNEEM